MVTLIVVLLPFWTSILVRSYAWMVLLGRRGLVNEALIAGGIIEHPLRLLNTPIAVHIAMIHILMPYMILPIANALRQIDPALPRAASGWGQRRSEPSGTLYCRCRCRVFWRACCWCSCCRWVYITPALVRRAAGHDDLHADRATGRSAELAVCCLSVRRRCWLRRWLSWLRSSACSASATHSGSAIGNAEAAIERGAAFDAGCWWW